MTPTCRRAVAARAVVLGLAAAALPAQTRLEMGKMWTFENPPLAYLEQEYGFKPTQEWLDALRLASLRLADKCSASFVSPKGLIMTNNHCVRDDIAQVASSEHDWVESGFSATTMEDELQLPGLTVQQLVSMRDVTAEMLAGIGEDDEETAVEEKRAANEEAILEKARAENPRFEPEVVALHNGAVFQLYSYKVWDDIRLVCTPHLQSAHYGGDPDNFTYPRYCVDFAFCRAYEDGQPADTSKHYFRWSETGALENDLVFVTGNPGSTGRLLTLAQMEYLRDAEYPLVLGMIEQRLAILRMVAETEPEHERQLRTVILGDENSVKALTGYLGGLLDDELMAHKGRLEAEFRSHVDADPALAAKYGGVWDRLDEICAARAALEPKRFFHEPSYSAVLARALAIVRAVDPQASEEERNVARRMALGMQMREARLFQLLFINHLLRARQWLPADDPYLAAVLGDADPVTAERRISESQVASRDFAAELLRGGREAVEASADPAIAAARVLAPLVAAHAEADEKLQAQEAVQSRLVGRALFDVYGDKISPDATMTLRFSDGRVKGYPYNGTIAPYRTTFYGLFARNVEFQNAPPFDLPSLWLEKRDQIDLGKALNFVSTNDIIGGNSGSPVVDDELRVVGLIFDGNIEQLPNRFLFRDRVERSVSVHVQGILEAMSAVYGAERVVKELTDAAGQ